MKNETDIYDVIVVGAGMGGMTAACLLAGDGLRVLVLEAGHVPGGCSSSYYRKGYTFESGATTLIGFDEYQPLRMLEERLGIDIPKIALNPSMTVHMNGKKIIRRQNRDEWVSEAIKHFGEPAEQKQFWHLAYNISDVVWKVSGKNNHFPPIEKMDWLRLLKNNPRHLWVLPYALKSVRQVARQTGISNPDFYKFLDEQLMISAQSVSEDTPFLFGSPAITYTNYTNYYVPGGLIEMVRELENYLNQHGGEVRTKEKVLSIDRKDGYTVKTSKNRTYRAKNVVSNIPIWNLPEITSGEISKYFRTESDKYSEAWGAFTMGIVTDDVYSDEMTLHHQLHIDQNNKPPGVDSDSVFVSFSHPEDQKRATKGERVLNISTHAKTDYWFNQNGNYDSAKEHTQEQIVKLLKHSLPGFADAEIKLVFSATPVTWSNWVYRKKGRVGGIPQSMTRSLLDWTPNKTPFNGLYLCGDTVFPGQGIPGVTLSGFNVYLRLQENF